MQQQRTAKECRACGKTKPLESFAPNRKMLDGRLHQCRTCLAAKQRARVAANPQRYLAKRRANYLANREREMQRQRDWKAANPTHTVKSRLAARRPDGRGYMVGYTYADIPVESIDYGKQLLNDPCNYCGGPAGELDHITPLAEGGTNDWWNLTAACRSCNRRKNDRSVLDMLMRLVLLDIADNWAPRLGEDLRLKRRAA